MLLALGWKCVGVENGRRQCLSVCDSEGFPSMRYVPESGGKGKPPEPAKYI